VIVRSTRIVRAAGVALMLLCGAAARIDAQTAGADKTGGSPAGNAETGRDLYRKVGCYQCHGLEGQGAAGTAPRLAPNPLPFPRFSAYVRAPTATMPPYRVVVLADQAMADIYAFLRTIPPPPPVGKIPLLAPSQFGVK
jgi:mono/diheme cytochrome c family protein